MPKNEEIKQKCEVSRRDFLVGAGSVLATGAVAGGLLTGCKGDTTTTTKTIEVPTTKNSLLINGGSTNNRNNTSPVSTVTKPKRLVGQVLKQLLLQQ
jgi:hypothetical protein